MKSPVKEQPEYRSDELALWKAWKDSNYSPAKLEPLLDKFTPLIQERASVYKNTGLRIPPGAIDAELQKHFIRALKTYDPSKNVALGTHIYSQLRAASRFITTHQNMARIPENRIYDIGQYQRARAVLDIASDKPPTTAELAKYLKWKVKDVMKMSNTLRKDLVMSQHLVMPRVTLSNVNPAIKFTERELSPFDRQVLNKLLQKQKLKDIAKSLNTNISAIARSKQRIANIMEKYLNNE